MAAAEMWRLDRAVILGVLSAVATANCGGESKTDVNEEVVTGGKSSSTGGVGTGGAGTTGGAATGGAKPSGGTVSTFGGSQSTAGMPATGGTGTGGKSTGGATATGGDSSASGGSATGGRAAAMGGRAAAMGGGAAMGGRSGIGGDGMGGNGDLPDDSCLEGCELAPQATPLCGERLTWVCFGTVSEQFNTPECQDAATQVPRFCCTRDFRPCE
jgi:hypothetical protein